MLSELKKALQAQAFVDLNDLPKIIGLGYFRICLLSDYYLSR